MIIKFKKSDGHFLVGHRDVEVYDNNGNCLNREITKININIEPGDVVSATCVFTVKEIQGELSLGERTGVDADVTTIASTSKEYVAT